MDRMVYLQPRGGVAGGDAGMNPYVLLRRPINKRVSVIVRV